MAEQSHFDLLRAGSEAWTEWRRTNPSIEPDLSDLSLDDADLQGINFSGVNLTQTSLVSASLLGADLNQATLIDANLLYANLRGATLRQAVLTGAVLNSADLSDADLTSALLIGASLRGTRLQSSLLTNATMNDAHFEAADLTTANLDGAWLAGASFQNANLKGAKLRGANLSASSIINTTFDENSDLSDARVFGVSAWDVNLHGAKQANLVITPPDQPTITVDNLEVAQFVYLLLSNQKIRAVIDTITSKVVLILGRFTPQRKAVLDAIREELGKLDYVPVVFDFDKPASRDTQETITTLARMARFVIADITDPRSIPQELVSIVEQLPSLPVQPILHEGSEPWGMYDHIRRYPWVLEVRPYRGLHELLPRLRQTLIAPVEAKTREVRGT